MTDVLGYERFAAQGGDWGALRRRARLGRTSRRAADRHPPQPAARARATCRPPSRRRGGARYLRELAALADGGDRLPADPGHASRRRWPTADRLAGRAGGWIVEKFRTWSDCGGDVERLRSTATAADERHALLGHRRDQLVVLAVLRDPSRAVAAPRDASIDVPTGYAEFPGEMLHPPRSFAERAFNIQRWTEMPRGGHFAALEEPDLLAEDVAAFFRPLRRG